MPRAWSQRGVQSPPHYDVSFGWDPAPEVEFYLEIFERQAGSVGVVLELGSGTGCLLAELARRGPYCVGLDVNPEMARFAARRPSGWGRRLMW